MKPLSVVIPTCGRRESLKALLAEILKSQDVVEEVLVAFDTAAPDESLAAGFPGVRVCSTGGEKGPAAARNAGARLARAEFLVFVDDDVVTAPGSIEAMAAALREGEGRVALAGQVVRHPSVREDA